MKPMKMVRGLIKAINQGYPTTVFRKISVRRSKNSLEFSMG